MRLREYAEIKWPQFSVVNHRRERMSPEISPELTVCQDEEIYLSPIEALKITPVSSTLKLAVPLTCKTDYSGNMLV